MWWTFFILFFLISIFSSIALFYALKRINQYEDLILQFQNVISIATNKMKAIDDKGSFESDDEVGFFFKQLKDIQLLLSDIFESQTIEENTDAKS